MKTVALVGTFDSKGVEFEYIKKLFEERGVHTLTIHVGTFASKFKPDINNEDILANMAGDLKEVLHEGDRSRAVFTMGHALKVLLPKLYHCGRFDAVFSLGGSGGTSLCAPAMQELPIGVPKIIVSTVASGNVEKYIGTSDLVLIPAIVDAAGINRISRKIIGGAVNAMCGMLNLPVDYSSKENKLIAATMFGVTTPCVERAKRFLEEKGFEVIVFHATGVGGKIMESLINDHYFDGILDLTTTEWADEIVGGELSAGRKRGEAASLQEIPQVVSIGALDMVNFGPYDTIPERFKTRLFYQHNPMVTLMRTNEQELLDIAEHLVSKWNMAKTDKIHVILPLKGCSMIDSPGKEFWQPQFHQSLIRKIRRELRKDICVTEMDCNINEESFAVTAAQLLCNMIGK